MIQLARRRLLQGLAWVLPGWALGLPLAAAGRRAEALGEIPANSLEAVGRAYLAAHPEERTIVAVMPHSSIQRLSRRARSDFGAGDVVWVRGFLLARCEARACAAQWLRHASLQALPSSSET